MRVEEFVTAEETMPEAAYRYLEEEVLTEASTDLIIDALDRLIGKSRLRFIPFLSGALLKWADSLLPEKLLEMIREHMVEEGMLDPRP